VAIYNGFTIWGGKNRPKMWVVIADFSKIEVRFKGIPEGGQKMGTALLFIWH